MKKIPVSAFWPICIAFGVGVAATQDDRRHARRAFLIGAAGAGLFVAILGNGFSRDG